jgi:hypothetical protein
MGRVVIHDIEVAIGSKGESPGAVQVAGLSKELPAGSRGTENPDGFIASKFPLRGKKHAAIVAGEVLEGEGDGVVGVIRMILDVGSVLIEFDDVGNVQKGHVGDEEVPVGAASNASRGGEVSVGFAEGERVPYSRVGVKTPDVRSILIRDKEGFVQGDNRVRRQRDAAEIAELRSRRGIELDELRVGAHVQREIVLNRTRKFRGECRTKKESSQKEGNNEVCSESHDIS